MSESILAGREGQISRIPRTAWEQHLAQVPEHARIRLSFMTEQHHRIRYFVVSELARRGSPLGPDQISKALRLPLGRVLAILAELERELFFLVRNDQGEVSWAYPITTEPTPHQLTFSTGERLFAA